MKASVSYRGDVKDNWRDLLDAFEFQRDNVSDYQSLIQGSVLPPDSGQELIFRVTSDANDPISDLAIQMGRAILEGDINISVCYCSVYDECWTSELNHLIQKSQGEQVPSREERLVSSCAAMEQSGI